MFVGRMRVRMNKVGVCVPMRMWFTWRIIWPVRVLVVLIMHMGVLMFHRLMRVLVGMPFREMDEHAGADQKPR